MWVCYLLCLLDDCVFSGFVVYLLVCFDFGFVAWFVIVGYLLGIDCLVGWLLV